VKQTPRRRLKRPNGDRILNFFDINRYLLLFNAQDPRADLAFPLGTLNFFDITTFIGNFNAGCL
jgi:hypothetical protein